MAESENIVAETAEKIFADLKRRNLTTIALIAGTDAFGKSMRESSHWPATCALRPPT